MHKEIREQNVKRIEAFLGRIRAAVIQERVPFTARFSRSTEPVPFEERLAREYAPIQQGDCWGEAWDSAWFNLKATVPDAWNGAAVAAQVELNGEALIFDESGCPVYGLSGGTIFIPHYKKDIYLIHQTCEGAEKIDLWIEAAANNIMGVEHRPSHPKPEDAEPCRGLVNRADLVRYDLDMWHLCLDVEVLLSLFQGLEDSPRRNRITRVLCEAIDLMLGQGKSAADCREHLKPLWTPANASDLSVTGIGHAHMDTGWLWPVKETVRKCARTFASQIAMLEKYPDYVFGASQPQHYQFVKQHYPALYEKIKAAVKEGRWELQGGMWVEADCNIIGGESMIRQFIHGKNFFMDEFGEDVRNLWLPDVFGYSAAMPQILRKCGVDFFMTQKISWNQFNTFPFNLFNWRGIDGTSVVTHFLPENNYNSTVTAEGLIAAQKRFPENDICDEFVSLYGVGDGGGGPKEDQVERGLRLRNLEGCPKWRPGKAGPVFERMRRLAGHLPSWSGELYLEMHRGTLTTHALIKKFNRTLERKLRAVEFLHASLPLADYPQAELDEIWKLVLLNQFHDILPGSSIREVYVQTRRELKDCLERCDALAAAAAEKLFAPEDDGLTFFNVLSCDYTCPVTLPESWRGFGVTDENGRPVAAQHEKEGAVVQLNIPANGTRTLRKGSPEQVDLKPESALVLENELALYEFDTDGRLLRGFDKEAGREIVLAPGNVFTLYEDNPLVYDAWDIDLFYESMPLEQARNGGEATVFSGPVRSVLHVDLRIGASAITQKISLAKGTKRLDFETVVDWKEEHRMLRVAFPVNVMANESTCDIQYGFAKRPNHRNTSWDMAKFEVAAHKYADLSDGGYGVALLNDCKYGYKILENVIDLNLLRSPTFPDSTADRHVHEFTYSLLPHLDTLIESRVIPEAMMLNTPPPCFENRSGTAYAAPCVLEGKGASLEVVKKAEKEDCLVIRVVETHGRESTALLRVADPTARLIPTNLIEWEDGAAMSCAEPVTISLKPFEILTFKIFRP
jgi:alpha-mannosidase